MGMYTGLRFKGIVKEKFRNEFEDIALNGKWKESEDKVFRQFGNVSMAGFIPCGSLAYMPDEWETHPYDKYGYGIATDGFNRIYDKNTGRWTFQCSLKNYKGTIEEFMKIIPYFIEEIEHLEEFYEEWVYSIRYDLIDNEIREVDDRFIKYRKPLL